MCPKRLLIETNGFTTFEKQTVAMPPSAADALEVRGTEQR